MKLARGMRNNNPLNIIKSEKINWQGEVKLRVRKLIGRGR